MIRVVSDSNHAATSNETSLTDEEFNSPCSVIGEKSVMIENHINIQRNVIIQCKFTRAFALLALSTELLISWNFNLC